MKSYTSVALFIVVLLCMPGLLFAYHILNDQTPSGAFVFKKWANVPVNFRVDPGTLGGGDGRQVVQAACDEWDNVPTALELCGSITTGQEDITAGNFLTFISLDDGINDIIFDETGDILSGLGLPPGVLGIGLSVTNATTGEITDAILIINGSVPSSPIADLPSTTVHEFGHIWGLAHTPIGEINTQTNVSGLDPIDPSAIPTMYPFSNPVNDAFGRNLEDDDTEAISLRYPNN